MIEEEENEKNDLVEGKQGHEKNLAT